jgi:hypothetical protein
MNPKLPDVLRTALAALGAYVFLCYALPSGQVFSPVRAAMVPILVALGFGAVWLLRRIRRR